MGKIDSIQNPLIRNYFLKINERVQEKIKIAKNAKAKGFDIDTFPGTRPAVDLADRAETITGPKGIAKRFRNALEENKKDRIKTIFQLFKEIVLGKESWYQEEDKEKRVEQAMRTALVLITEGVVVSPLDGVPRIKISKNFDGSEYVDIYYAGPIRAAGGTATVFPLILGDYAQKLLGLQRFKPTEEEIERYVEEAKIYQDEIVARQIKLKPEQARIIVKNCPVCINGEATEEKEVTVNRDLPRIPSNRIRGAAMLVLTEGVALKAKKVLTFAKMLDLDWNWLEKIQTGVKKSDTGKKISEDWKYLDRIAAGRPIFAYPSRVGGFRLRYGRCRNSGAMSKCLHPATMHLLDDFIAVGTQLKVERPGKSAGVSACDFMEGPIVLLKDDSVVKVKNLKQSREIENQIKEFLFLGDHLVSFGDFRKSAHSLVPVGYCEEWWVLELEKASKEKKEISIEKFLKKPREINCYQAIELSLNYGIPLHPEFIHYYSRLNFEELQNIVKEARNAEKVFEKEKIVQAKFSLKKETKKSFEKIGIEHKIKEEKIIIEKNQAYSFLKTLGALKPVDSSILLDKEKKIIENLTGISGIKIKDKCGTFIGARMGRPEQAKPRQMTGNPHCLFPIGMYGGATRSINKAIQKNQKKIEVSLALFQCPKCGKKTIRNYCEECNERTKIIKHCKKCGKILETEKCQNCDAPTTAATKTLIDINTEARKATNNLKITMPNIVKGVKGMFSKDKIAEPLEKGILRAIHDLHVFKDGTIRFEMINAAVSHIRPKEINLTIEKMKELGYEKDYLGNELKTEEQIVELFPQDVIINEKAGDFMVKVTRFIDDLLESYYKEAKLFKKTKREDMIGELVLGLAPHTSAAIVGRIIGFTKARVCFAHPFFHLCKRRNIDGDQDSMLLLMDALLNFSEKFLSTGRGGRMDAPIVFTTALDPEEIDDEAHEMETCLKYPLELYEKSEEYATPFQINIPIIAQTLGSEKKYRGLNFTHDTSQFDEGPIKSKYVELQTMEEKITSQAKLQQKIQAIDKKNALERVIMSHFIPDIIGNARGFSRQTFRCTKCNTKYRRIPLIGKCTKCGGKVILTIAQGSVKKYLQIAKNIIREYELSEYLKQRLDLAEKEINSIFDNDKSEQKKLFEFV